MIVREYRIPFPCTIDEYNVGKCGERCIAICC